MFNNVVLDVVIGLVFIYLLYSLLTTTINEFVTIIFAYRSRMLERGIEQMLDGENYSYYWWDKVINGIIFLGAIVFCKKETRPKRKDYFKKGTADIGIPRMKLNNKAALFAAQITSHALYKRAAENSWLYKKPAYLDATTFSDILIDILGNQKKTDTSVPVLMKDIAEYVNLHIKRNSDLQKILNIYIEQANGDLQRFRHLVENWYDSTMDRVSGWYKKQANKVVFIIGLCLAIAFNVSTIDIVRKLSADKDVREALVKSATEYVNNNMATVKTASQQNKVPPDKNAALSKPDSASTKKDSTSTEKRDTTFDALKDKLAQMKSLYNTQIAEANTTLGMGWDDFGFTADSLQWVKDGALTQNAPQHKTFIGKIGYVLHKVVFTPHYWLGFLITAFAISLGAPFWFDLLNKFIKLRASGQKPDSSTTTASASKTTLINQKPDPRSFG